MRVVEAVDEVNKDQKMFCSKNFVTSIRGSLRKKWHFGAWLLNLEQTICVKLLRFLIESLLEANCKIVAYDPVAMEEAKKKVR